MEPMPRRGTPISCSFSQLRPASGMIDRAPSTKQRLLDVRLAREAGRTQDIVFNRFPDTYWNVGRKMLAEVLWANATGAAWSLLLDTDHAERMSADQLRRRHRFLRELPRHPRRHGRSAGAGRMFGDTMRPARVELAIS